MTEAILLRRIMAYLKTLRPELLVKLHGSNYQRAGLMDIHMLLNAQPYYLEVKTPTGKLTPLQAATLARLNRVRTVAWVVRSVEEVKAIVERHGKE